MQEISTFIEPIILANLIKEGMAEVPEVKNKKCSIQIYLDKFTAEEIKNILIGFKSNVEKIDSQTEIDKREAKKIKLEQDINNIQIPN